RNYGRPWKPVPTQRAPAGCFHGCRPKRCHPKCISMVEGCGPRLTLRNVRGARPAVRAADALPPNSTRRPAHSEPRHGESRVVALDALRWITLGIIGVTACCKSRFVQTDSREAEIRARPRHFSRGVWNQPSRRRADLRLYAGPW